MGVYAGPDVSESGLVLALDVGNKKTFANSVINSTSWDLGSGSASGYGQNGNTNENERVTGTDPFGKSATVWETRASGDGNADGGWNSDWYNIDNTKLYRFSVWVKRTSTSSGGTFYLGLYGNASGIRRTDTNAYEGNPYWECSGTSKFTQDVWYLVVGHCYPYNTSYTGQHPETGIYTVAGGTTKVLSINACNIGADVKWAGSDVTQTIHRCYHYYCGDSTTRLQLFDPRIDAIDGNEPSISALLSGFTANRLTDLVGTNNGTFKNAPTYASANGGSISFDGSNDYIQVPSLGTLSQYTISYWAKRDGEGRMLVSSATGSSFYWYGDNSWRYTHGGNGGEFYYPKPTSIPVSTWGNYVVTYDGSKVVIYRQGIYQGEQATTGSANFTMGLRFGWFEGGSSYSFLGLASLFQIHNRALTAAEIQQNFNSTRGRFGI